MARARNVNVHLFETDSIPRTRFLGPSIGHRTGSGNGCELEIAATTNPVYDLERFGIQMGIREARVDTNPEAGRSV